LAHTFTNLLTHVIFSTKGRAPMIAEEIRDDLFAYMGGIIRKIGGTAIVINGVTDHVHLLIVLPADASVSDCLRTLKTNSTRWVHEKYPERRSFAWQTGYAAFAVSDSHRSNVIAYIQNQQEHHKRVTFDEEFLTFLKRHKIDYDPRFVLD
jgi:REP element-mobilizing transposase RayT